MPARSPAFVIVLLATLALAACGETRIDPSKAEDLIAADFRGAEVRSVECPDDVEVVRGETFECTAETSEGKATVVLKITDDEGTVEPESVEPAK